MPNDTVVALIPARGGSKAIPKKNIVDLGGFPLLAYSIGAAKLAKNISRIIVSTDSEEIAAVAKQYGAEVPFLRPAEYASDSAADLDVVKHALGWLQQQEHYEPSLMVYLRPTTPLRDPSLLDEAIDLLLLHPEATCLRSGHEIRESPYKLFAKEGEYFVGLFPRDQRPEYYNLPRQAFPPVYQPDGYVDIWKRSTIEETGMLHGSKILAFVAPDVGELDSIKDLDFLKFQLTQGRHKVFEYLEAQQ